MKKEKWAVILLLCAVALCGVFGCDKDTQTPNGTIEAGVDYDVIVVGGDPEGVCAAVSSARSGLKTLLIEDDHALGGLMTLGQLNFIDICEDRQGNILTQGLFMEFYNAVGGTAFDVETAKQFFYDWVVNEEHATLKLNTAFVEPVMDGDSIVGVVVNENGEEKTYTASRIIDATVDADVAAAAGAPYTVAGEDYGEKDRQMGVTLVFELSGVNWDAVTDYLENDDNTGTGATNKAAWGYSREGYGYEPKDPMMRLRGFNVARQDNGNVLINALIIFGVDPLSEESKANGIARAQKELEYIVPYVRENFIGFENAELAGTAEQLYVRESRHIIGEYQLTIDDVLENRDQWDKIAIVAYPADIQPAAGQTYGVVVGSPDRYAIPFRSIVPLDVENMLVIGRSASYTSLAAGSARVIPVGMAEGEAAGVASAYSLNHDMSFRDMTKNEKAIADVQKTLKQQGAYLDDFEVHETFMDHWAYPGVKVLRSLGIVSGGYGNDYGLDQELSKGRLQNLLNNTMSKTGKEIEKVTDVSDPVTNLSMIAVTARIAEIDAENYDEQIAALQEMGILTDVILQHMGAETDTPMVAEAVMIVANLYTFMVQ